MWISKIKLINFKSYEHVEFNFPKPEQGQNITLIGAENGHGKTTLLESIYVGLYGPNAARQLTRAGIVDASYEVFLKNALHNNAKAEAYSALINMTVELTVLNDEKPKETNGIRINRTWSYDKKTKKRDSNNDQCRIFKITSEGDYPIKKDEHERVIDEYSLPYEHAPFFFFDGEKVVQQAQDVGTGTWLKKGLDGLCGIELLRELEIDLKKYVQDCIRASNPKDKDIYERFVKEYDDLVARQNSLTAKTEDFKRRKLELTEKEELLQNRLGGVGASAQSTEQIRSQISATKEKSEKADSDISRALKTLPLALISNDEATQLAHILQSEANRLRYEDGKTQGESKIEDFIKAFAGSAAAKAVVGPKTLNSPEMRQAIQEAWHTLWYPLPNNCAENIRHNYLTLSSHSDIHKIFSELPAQSVDLETLCNVISECDEKITHLTKELSALSDSDNDEVLEELKITSTELKNIIQSFTASNNASMQNVTRIAEKELQIDEYKNKILNNEPNQEKAFRAEKTQAIIQELMTKIIEQKLIAVSNAATAMNKKLAHDERIEKIEINSKGTFTLSKGSTRLEPSSLSAGQMQVLILSLVAALAEVTHYAAPYVVDTPLAKLDSGHRQNLINHWKSLPHQVILLSQDTEITSEIKDSLEPFIQKSYLIKAESLAEGGARSVLIENAYF